MEGYSVTEYYIIEEDEEEDDHNVKGHTTKEYKQLEEEDFI
jgi:hypothetical protein